MITATDLWKGRIFLPAFLAVLSAGASPVLGQQAPRYPDPARLLEKSIIAARLLNVEGRETLVVAAHSIYGTQFLKRSILRSSKGHSLITWLNENGKAGSFVYEDGEWSNFFDPRTGQLKVTRCLPRNESPDYAARHVRLMMRNYAPKIAGTAPMAGRDCYLLRLTPRYKGSYSITLWIDTKTNYLLGHTEINDRTETVSTATFDGIKFPTTIPESAFKVLPTQARGDNYSRSQRVFDLASLKKIVNFDFQVPYVTPCGYEFVCGEKVSMKGIDQACMRYSDGVADITICQSKTVQPRSLDVYNVRTSSDAMNNQVVEIQSGNMDTVIVGHTEIPVLMELARAMNNDQEKAFLDYISTKTGVSKTTIVSARNMGINVDTLYALTTISKMSSLSPASLIKSYQDGIGWQTLARKFRLNPTPIARQMELFKPK